MVKLFLLKDKYVCPRSKKFHVDPVRGCKDI